MDVVGDKEGNVNEEDVCLVDSLCTFGYGHVTCCNYVYY